MQARSIPIINALEIHVLHSCLKPSGYISLHMTLMYQTYFISIPHVWSISWVHIRSSWIRTVSWCQTGTRTLTTHYVDSPGQDCSVPVANALEILQSSSKPTGWMSLYLIMTLICHTYYHHRYSQGLDASQAQGHCLHHMDALVQARSIPIMYALDILHSCIKPSWYTSLHMTLLYHTVNFMDTHKVIIDMHSVLVPVRHQATVHTLCRRSCARLQHPCCKCTGDTAVQQRANWMYGPAYHIHKSHMLPFQCYTCGQFYGYT